MDREQLLNADQELQRLSFNLLDALDTLNVHSLGEVVRDLRRSIFPLSHGLQTEVRRFIKGSDRVRAAFPDVDTAALEQDLSAMDALLDMLHKCTGEVKNYKEFVDGLIPLIRKCESWSEQGPLAARGAW